MFPRLCVPGAFTMPFITIVLMPLLLPKLILVNVAPLVAPVPRFSVLIVPTGLLVSILTVVALLVLVGPKVICVGVLNAVNVALELSIPVTKFGLVDSTSCPEPVTPLPPMIFSTQDPVASLLLLTHVNCATAPAGSAGKVLVLAVSTVKDVVVSLYMVYIVPIAVLGALGNLIVCVAVPLKYWFNAPPGNSVVVEADVIVNA